MPLAKRSKICGRSLFGNAAAVVLDRDAHPRPVDPRADRHRAAVRRVAQRVGHQIRQDLADSERIDVDERQLADLLVIE